MPFKFKLSKRLALMKALLAASAGLALACDRADLTSPQSLSRPLAYVIVTSPSPISVVASTDDGSNVPSNTLDNSLATRWSARGDGQWIHYDLGTIVTMDHVDIAWYVGDTRSTYFDIEVSSDTVICSASRAVAHLRISSSESRRSPSKNVATSIPSS